MRNYWFQGTSGRGVLFAICTSLGLTAFQVQAVQVAEGIRASGTTSGMAVSSGGPPSGAATCQMDLIATALGVFDLTAVCSGAIPADISVTGVTTDGDGEILDDPRQCTVNSSTPAAASCALTDVGFVFCTDATCEKVEVEDMEIFIDLLPAAGPPGTLITTSGLLESEVTTENDGSPQSISESSESAAATGGANLRNAVGNLASMVPSQGGSTGRAGLGRDNQGSLQFQKLAGGGKIRSQSAGDGFGYPWGVWASYQRTEFEDNFAATAFDADSNAVFVGTDFNPWDNVLAGVAFGYDNTDVDTTFNRGNQDIDAISIIPYFGATISEHVGVDYDLDVNFAIGYSSVDIDQFRTAPGTTTRVTSSTDSDRWFFSGNVNAGQTYANLTLRGQAGLLVARDNMDGFTESDGTVILDRRFELGRITVGGEAAYFWSTFEPYVSAHYEYDYEMTKLGVVTGTQPANDDDDILFGVGVRWFGDQFSASFGYTTVLDREDFDSDAFAFQIRGDF